MTDAWHPRASGGRRRGRRPWLATAVLGAVLLAASAFVAGLGLAGGFGRDPITTTVAQPAASPTGAAAPSVAADAGAEADDEGSSSQTRTDPSGSGGSSPEGGDADAAGDGDDRDADAPDAPALPDGAEGADGADEADEADGTAGVGGDTGGSADAAEPQRDVRPEDVAEQLTVFAVGGADAGWCDLAPDHLPVDTSGGPLLTPPVRRDGRPTDPARTVEDRRLCVYGLRPADEVDVEIVDPTGGRTVTTVAPVGDDVPGRPSESSAFAAIPWVGSPDVPLGTWTAQATVDGTVLTTSWQLVDRDTPNFIVLDGWDRIGGLRRPATVRIALAGYAAAATVDLHVYHSVDGDEPGDYYHTRTVTTDGDGEALHVVDADTSFPPGCYRVEEDPESVRPDVMPYGRVFCLE
jgi:hypothetical protein